MRKRLPNRRSLETVASLFEGQRFKVGLGREVLDAAVGPVAEVFINAQKPNSLLDTISSDGAILMSLLIQSGYPPEMIRHSLRRNSDGTPASPLGFAADLLGPGA